MKVELIRPEELDVISQVHRLEADIFPDPWSEREVESTVRQKQTFCAAAKESDSVLGYFLCYYVLDECEIARIAVDKGARRGGIGNALLAYILDICREKQIERILLDVRAENQGAIAFYEKNGFARDGVRKGYYGGKNPEDAVLMSRNVEMLSAGNA